MMNTPASHFVYQRLHVLGGRALHLAEHLRIAARAFEHVYGVRPALDSGAVAARISDALRGGHHATSRTGATVILRLAPDDEATGISAAFERQLMEAGYYMSALRPKARSYDYSIPFGGFPTNFQLDAQAMFDTLAFRGHGAGRSVRRRGDVLLSCGDAPLFAIRGRVLFTTPLTEGAMDGVERGTVIAAADRARLTVREEPILHTELKSCDELFLADAAGITSISECDGAHFMSLIAPRLADAMN
ncbi:MAG: aminotransferase class IV [Alistipes sp.]|jgi:hypothetical protein|nr:aminotransferase class IV [Alistipes sp.]